MSGFLTKNYLDGWVDLPTSCPIVELPPEAWLVISQVRLDAPSELELHWSQIYVSKVVDDGQVIEQVDTTRGLVFASVYRDFVASTPPQGQSFQDPPVVAGGILSTPPFFSTRQGGKAVWNQPGVYSMVVCNNTKNATIWASFTGQFRIVFDPAAT